MKVNVKTKQGRLRMVEFLIALVLVIGISFPAHSVWVGGYYDGADTGNCRPVVEAFLNNINASVIEGPFEGRVANFDSDNDNWNSNPPGFDWYDFGFVCAHGNQWRFEMVNGMVNLNSAGFGSSAAQGWGDDFLEWVVLYSCLVVASPLENPQPNWWSVWKDDPNDVFDGLHILNGFRTNAWVPPAQTVASQYARKLNNGEYILYAWFDAVTQYGWWWLFGNDRASSVFWDSNRYDTMSSFSPDPPTETIFVIRYMN
ncbi:MAG: hypothetical protein JSV88_21745 [Candidatus Aminicenantes bacterium]|nr:MAG: hypothetical protein JSV88_21745 [Candidatus Aminicenantes bacterium]